MNLLANPTEAVSMLKLVKSGELVRPSLHISVLREASTLPTNRPRGAFVNERSSTSHYYPVFRKTERQTAPLYLAQAANAHVATAHMYIQLTDGSLILESLPHRKRMQNGIQAVVQESFSGKPKSLSGSFIACGHEQGANYFHWHIDCLTAVIAGCSKHPVSSILCPRLSRWQRASMHHLGIAENQIIQSVEPLVTVDELIWASPLTRDQFLMTDAVLEVFSRIQHSVHQDSIKAVPEAEKIYVARVDANARKLLNEDNLIAALKVKGYKIIVPSELTYEEQVGAFSRAKIIVGLHCAGLTNIGFAPRDCQIIEIFPDIYLNTGFYGIVQVTKQPYYYYAKSTSNGPAATSMQPAYWSIDVADFLAAYKDLL